MNILITGVGGQGILLASRVLGNYAVSTGLDCKLSEVHGMAQRGGSVITFVKMGEKVYSPIIDNNGADVLLAFEKLEALRYLHYLKKDGKVIYSTQEIMPMSVVTGQAQYPKDITEKLPNAVGLDALSLASVAGNTKATNSVMLGAFTSIMKFDKEKMLSALKASIPEKLYTVNERAFELGYSEVK